MDNDLLSDYILNVEKYLTDTSANNEVTNSFKFLKNLILNVVNKRLNYNIYSYTALNLHKDNEVTNLHTLTLNPKDPSSDTFKDSSNTTKDDSKDVKNENILNLLNYSNSIKSYNSITTNTYSNNQNPEDNNTNSLTRDGSDNSTKDYLDTNGWTIGTSKRNIKMDSSLINEYLSQIGRNWHLDLLELSNLPIFLEQGPIFLTGKYLLQSIGDQIHENFNHLILPVLRDIQQVYLPNPYHNALHGATVGHMSKLLANIVTKNRKLKPLEEFGFIIASLGHDAGHPGKTNSFLSSTGNPLSLIYNDNSILENYHCSLIFHIIRYHSEFFTLIPQNEWEWIRKRMIQLVLSTDMKTHFTHIDNVKNKRENNEFDIANDDDFWLLLVLCIKAADIGHNFLPWVDHLPWTHVLFEEFYLQGDEERLLSMPLLLFFDRTKSSDIPDSQLGFFNAFTKPLLMELNYFDTNKFIDEILLKNSKENLENWRKYKGKSIHQILYEFNSLNLQHHIPDAFISP